MAAVEWSCTAVIFALWLLYPFAYTDLPENRDLWKVLQTHIHASQRLHADITMLYTYLLSFPKLKHRVSRQIHVARVQAVPLM